MVPGLVTHHHHHQQLSPGCENISQVRAAACQLPPDGQLCCLQSQYEEYRSDRGLAAVPVRNDNEDKHWARRCHMSVARIGN